MFNGMTRRSFMKKLLFLLGSFLGISFLYNTVKTKGKGITASAKSEILSDPKVNDQRDRFSYIYHAQNGTPEQNTAKVLEMMGGIERFIGKDDIVILKPNAQWWNQGMTNTNAMKAFIALVLAIPGCKGEIIIADNNQFYSLTHGSNFRGCST